jgi:hypothetical protein
LSPIFIWRERSSMYRTLHRGVVTKKFRPVSLNQVELSVKA